MQTDLGLTDVSGNAHNINGIATVNAQDGQFSDRIGTGAYNATSGYPAGWAGGLHTWDVYGEGTLGAGKGGAIASSINSSGSVQGQVLLLGAIATPEQACGGTSASAIGTTVSVAIGSWAQNKDGSGQPLVCKLDPVSGSGQPIPDIAQLIVEANGALRHGGFQRGQRRGTDGVTGPEQSDRDRAWNAEFFLIAYNGNAGSINRSWLLSRRPRPACRNA